MVIRTWIRTAEGTLPLGPDVFGPRLEVLSGITADGSQLLPLDGAKFDHLLPGRLGDALAGEGADAQNDQQDRKDDDWFHGALRFHDCLRMGETTYRLR